MVAGSEGVLAWGTGGRSTMAGVSVLSVVDFAMSKGGLSSEEDMVIGKIVE